MNSIVMWTSIVLGAGLAAFAVFLFLLLKGKDRASPPPSNAATEIISPRTVESRFAKAKAFCKREEVEWDADVERNVLRDGLTGLSSMRLAMVMRSYQYNDNDLLNKAIYRSALAHPSIKHIWVGSDIMSVTIPYYEKLMKDKARGQETTCVFPPYPRHPYLIKRRKQQESENG
jgi:hypothetical protein